MRTGSRLSELQFEDLLSRFAEAKGIVVWVSESAETLYRRLDDGDPWHAAVAERLDELLARQAEVMANVSKVAPVVQIIPTEGKDVRGGDFALGRFAE